MSTPVELIPVTLLTGFLGSGKTTVLNHLVQQPELPHHHDVNRHDDHIRAFCFSVDVPIPEEVFAAWLEVSMSFVGADILRVKGILNIEGSDRPVVIHGVQHIFHPPVTLPAWPSDDKRSRLVFITRDVGRDVIEDSFRAFSHALPKAWEAVG